MEQFNKGDTTISELVQLEEQEEGVDRRTETPLECAWRAVSAMLHADDAGFVSRPPKGLDRLMTLIVEDFVVFDLTVSEKRRRC